MPHRFCSKQTKKLQRLEVFDTVYRIALGDTDRGKRQAKFATLWSHVWRPDEKEGLRGRLAFRKKTAGSHPAGYATQLPPTLRPLFGLPGERADSGSLPLPCPESQNSKASHP